MQQIYKIIPFEDAEIQAPRGEACPQMAELQAGAHG